jgi:hypothetical protein
LSLDAFQAESRHVAPQVNTDEIDRTAGPHTGLDGTEIGLVRLTQIRREADNFNVLLAEPM